MDEEIEIKSSRENGKKKVEKRAEYEERRHEEMKT